MIQAKADLSDLFPKFKSQTEADWYNLIGPARITDETGELVIRTDYEPMRFKIPGGFYTPDFMHICESGRMIFVEVKGSRKQRGYRDSRSKWRAAAYLHPWAMWLFAVEDEGWKVEEE